MRQNTFIDTLLAKLGLVRIKGSRLKIIHEDGEIITFDGEPYMPMTETMLLMVCMIAVKTVNYDLEPEIITARTQVLFQSVIEHFAGEIEKIASK